MLQGNVLETKGLYSVEKGTINLFVPLSSSSLCFVHVKGETVDRVLRLLLH